MNLLVIYSSPQPQLAAIIIIKLLAANTIVFYPSQGSRENNSWVIANFKKAGKALQVEDVIVTKNWHILIFPTTKIDSQS